MCSIAGIVCDLIDDNQKEIVKSMTQQMLHRGPETQNYFSNDQIAFGHSRLKILDISDNGNQPMLSSDKKIIVVYNGEIYNFKEIKNTYFSNHDFKSNSDTEVIIASYLKWGINCIKYFNGMFSFAIWDDNIKKLFLVRDRLGIKPLYYTHTTNMISFSSELRPLLTLNKNKNFNNNSLSQFVQYQFVQTPETIVNNIKSLQAASYMEWTTSSCFFYKYWNIEDYSKNQKIDNYDYYKKNIRKLFINSINNHIISDVPYCVFLSGGVDSTAIVSTIKSQSQSKINTLHVKFNESKYNESEFAQLISKQFKTNHTEINITPNFILENINLCLDALDSPSGDGINTFFISKAAKDLGFKVALSGLGSDELFGGYKIFRFTNLLNKIDINDVPYKLRLIINRLIKENDSSSKNKIKEILSLKKIDFNQYYSIYQQVFSEKQINELLKNKSINNLTLNTKYDSNFLFSQTTDAEISTYLQNILLRDVDSMSMANSIEIRVPFLDHNLVEFVASIPDKYKNSLFSKKIFNDSMIDYIPKKIVNRTKMGFTFPWDIWLKNELKEFGKDNLFFLKNFSVFNENKIDLIWSEFLKNSKVYNWRRVWHLVVLGYWLKKNGIKQS